MRNAAHLAKAVTNNGEGYSDEYYTPRAVYEPLGTFDLDPCAGPVSSIATVNWRDRRGLTAPWFGRVFLNPPYSKDGKDRFMAAMARHGQGTALVPSATDTQWFQVAAMKAAALLFLSGRVQFERPGGLESANAGGSVLMAFGELDRQALLSAWKSGFLEGLYIECQPGNGKPYGGLFAP